MASAANFRSGSSAGPCAVPPDFSPMRRTTAAAATSLPAQRGHLDRDIHPKCWIQKAFDERLSRARPPNAGEAPGAGSALCASM